MNGSEKTQSESILRSTIQASLEALENAGDIVICSSSPNDVTIFLCNRLEALLPTNTITPTELAALRVLVHHAVNDKRFFDWEMPTLTGLSAQEFTELAGKLPVG